MSVVLRSNSTPKIDLYVKGKERTTARSTHSFENYLNKHGIPLDSHLKRIELFFVFMATQLKVTSITVKTLKSTIANYKEYLDQQIVIHQLRLQERNALLTSLTYFIQYLYAEKSMDVRPDHSLLFFNEPLFDDLGCKYFRDYIRLFIKRNYTCVDDKIGSIKHFLKHVNVPEVNIEQLTLKDVITYEKIYYLDRVNREVITKQTARRALDRVKNFLIYLKNLQVIRFAYKVPGDLSGTESRDNEFVRKDILIPFYETIKMQNTLTSKKYLCVFLLLIETGCRPIEICNLRYSDFNETESTLSFNCIKSDRRELKIDLFIKAYLVQYIQNQRKCLLPNESLFCKEDGTPLNTDSIGQYFQKCNQLAFGELKFSAKSLRHTFITSALEEKNFFDQVSKSVGHKNWRSTMHYLHRSIPRLLDNTLPYNPNVRSNVHDIPNKLSL